MTAVSLSERVVDRLARVGRATDVGRRTFLQRVTLAATALTVNPFDFILKPGTAYASVCGDANECSDGWSAFCCTINDGKNTCPPGSYAAGWWKVDNSDFCRGAARYYIDCNRLPSSSCRCTCADGDCDRRRVCCNNFRYGQCNQQIKGTTEVVCRIITCMPPWKWDPSCTRTSLSSPSTRTHSASCLPGEWPSHIEIKYQDMGLRGSVLRDPVHPERDAANGGRYRGYDNGFIFWSSTFGAHEVHGSIANRYDELGRETSVLRYPATDQRSVNDGRGVYSRFERGAIYRTSQTGTWAVAGPVDVKHREHDGVKGPLGYPLVAEQRLPDGGRRQVFEHGDIYWSSTTGAGALWGGTATRYRELGGPTGDHALGYPIRDTHSVGAGARRVVFQGGELHWREATGGHAVWGELHDHYVAVGGGGGSLGLLVRGHRRTPIGDWALFDGGGVYWSSRFGARDLRRRINDKYLSLGGPRGLLGMVNGNDRKVGDGRGRRARFLRGRIWWSAETGAHEVHGPILGRYLELGGPTGDLGYPTTDVKLLSGGRERSRFEHGTLTYDPGSDSVSRS